MTKHKKNHSFYFIFLQLFYLLYLQATEETFSPQRKHPALQSMKFLNFLFLWVIFALLDLDPHPHPQHCKRRGSRQQTTD
jgi:hypothetical protein